MPSLLFDAMIILGDHHFAAAGLDPEQRRDAIVAVVRSAVQRQDGANWINVEAADFPPTCPGWVTVYPLGCSRTPDTQPWRQLRHQVEEMAKAVLVSAAALF